MERSSSRRLHPAISSQGTGENVMRAAGRDRKGCLESRRDLTCLLPVEVKTTGRGVLTCHK